MPIFRFVFFSANARKCCCFLRSSLRNCSNCAVLLIEWHAVVTCFSFFFFSRIQSGLKRIYRCFFCRGNHNANVLELNARINITWYLNQLARAQQKHTQSTRHLLLHPFFRAALRLSETKQNKRQMFMHSNEPSKVSTICTFVADIFSFLYPFSSSICCTIRCSVHFNL